jgi:hypothetical protein
VPRPSSRSSTAPGYLVTAEPGQYDVKPLDDLNVIGV